MPADTHAPEPAALLVDAKRAAALLSLSPRKVWSLTAGGELPCVRVGRAVRYSVESLREWIVEHERAGR